MRHPTNGLSEDDLSRLTGSSSSASCDNKSLVSSNSSSSSSNSSPADSLAVKKSSAHVENFKSASLDLIKSPEKKSLNNSINNTQNTTTATNKTSSCFNSTYLPEIINPLEWQKSRKRKDRLDSTSSAILDRKLQRSNSEELIAPQIADNTTTQEDQQTSGQDDNTCPNTKAISGGQTLKTSTTTDVLRRVSSEDFNRSQTPINTKSSDSLQNPEEPINENDSSWSNRQQQQQQQSQTQQKEKPFSLECWIGSYSCPTKDMTRRARYETSPARSHRLSPIRNNNNSNGNKPRDSDDSECEHERRRNSERFCKSRAPPGRKASGVTKKSSSKYYAAKLNDENAYKYDLSTLKYERRGFISKKVIQGEKSSNSSTPTSDHNDNNLIDFHEQQKQQEQEQQQNSLSPSDSATGNDDKVAVNSSSNSTPTSPSSSNHSILKQKQRAYSVPPVTSAQEALPWGRHAAEDQAPVLSRRYATVRHHPCDNIDTAAKLSKVSPYPQQFHKQNAASQQLVDDLYDSIEPLNIYKGFSSLTSLRTSEVMTQVLPVMMTYQSPEERLNQVNKRMSSLKKKLAQLEEAYEARLGYRLSQAERLNDKQMKNIMAELSKLRKERHELKADPMGAMGLRVSGGDATKKLEKMQITLLEIEENLATKRTEANRSEGLEDLNADQLVQEKSAVQHGLLYFESLYGRPSTKDERDAARPLYDRYRQLKRMVSRSVLMSGNSISGIPELPTILENEAMVFESTPPQQYSSNNSTETNSPSDTLPPNSINSIASDDSTTTTTTTNVSAANRNALSGSGVEKPCLEEGGDAKVNTSPPRKISTSENIGMMTIEQLWEHLEKTSEEKKLLKRSIREYETVFEEQNGRKMLKSDRKTIEETYAQYKEKKAKARLLEALIKKQIQR